MRVLWLCSTPALAASRLGVPEAQVGGWVGALQAALEPYDELQLSVAFPWSVDEVGRFREGRHEYLPFPAYPRGGRLRRLLFDVSCRLEPASQAEHLDKVVELSQPDLIHVWGTESFLGLVAERSHLPVLVELQGIRTACAEVYCAGLTSTDLLRHGSPKRLLNGRSLLHQYRRYVRSATRERRILEVAEYVAGRTEWDRLMARALAPQAAYFRSQRLLRAPFYRARWQPQENAGPVRLVTVTRGNAYKGIETVARCAGLLKQCLPRGFEWTLVGVRGGEEVHRIVERKLGVDFGELGLRLVGRQPAEEVASHLTSSDIFVLSSRIENSPNALCEAMMVGMPIVSTNVGGIPSLLRSGQEGLLVPAGDPWAMAGAVVRIADDTELAERMARAAHARAAGRHDQAAVGKRTISMYRQVLNAAGREAAGKT